MANSVGQINFGVGVDASGITAELNRALTPALAAIQQKLNQKPLHVPIEIDTAAAITAARTALGNAKLKIEVKLDLKITPTQRAAIEQIKTLSDKTVNIRFNVDLTSAQIKQMRDAASAIRRLESKSVRVEVAVALSAEELKRIRDAASAIRRLESKNVTVRVDTNLTEAQAASLRNAASAIRRLESKSIVIRVDIQVDEARLRALATVLRDLRDRNLRVSVNAEHSPVDRLAHSLGTLTKFTGIGAAIAAGLGLIVGAAGAAAGAVGGLAVGLVALGPALAAIGGTAVVGFQGIGDAFSALSDLSANAAAEAGAQSDAIASASDGVTAALDAQESAQQSLNNAQEAAADAAKAVGDAYKTAQERLDGYSQSLRESTLDQREAELDLAEARKKLLTGKFTDPIARQRAILAVERAEINLQKAQKAGTKLAQEANEAQEKGIDQADEVVAARKNQAKADQEVANAQKALQRSNEAVAKAYQQLAKAQSTASASADKFSQALARLAPGAQAFVLAWRDLGPALKDVQKGVQESLFADLGDELTETAHVILPAVKEGMQGVAGELNAMAKSAFEFLRSEEGMRGLNAAFASGENLLRGLRAGTGEFTAGIIDLTTTAAPRMEEIGRSLAAIGEGIGRAFSEAANSGALDTLLHDFAQVMTSLGPLLENFTGSLITLGSEVLPSLVPFFKTLGDTLTAIAPTLGDLGATFVEALTAILPTLGDLIQSLSVGLKPVLPVVAELLKSIGVALQPLIGPLSRITVILGDTLVKTIDTLAPALEPLTNAFADLLQAIAPLVPMIADSLTAVIVALAPALSEVFRALAPVVAALAEQMKPVIAEIAPVLAEFAGILGHALADAITRIAPVLPELVTAMTDLLIAIIPLLPELARMAAEILPPLIDVLVQVTPILLKMIEVFTWLVEQILPGVITAIEGFGQRWSDQFEFMGDSISWLTDTVFPKIGEALESMKGWFGSAVEWIGNKWAELMDKAAVPVNFIIDAVWNNGLLKAWGNIDNLLGGVLPDASPLSLIPRRAAGGPIGFAHGPGNGTKDDILTWMSNGEHVITAAEVLKAGGQNILYAIRDMIARGIPFTWDNGRIITQLGRDNLSAYGAKVSQQGVGNVAPEGLFDQLARGPIPQFAGGGPIMPWMLQLQKGHEFAKAQNGKPYQWAGPRFTGDSFDCSGFMGSIVAAILGQNPWQRYWATASFAGYPGVGPQGLTKNLFEGSGMAVGITDDPGGAGGGHTAGELRGIPELSINAARVESGGSLGDVHYGRGTDPNSFASLYGLPIGANGFFQPAPGGSANGPSVAEQSSFLTGVIERMIKAVTDPVRDLIKIQIGSPPPSVRALPLAALTGTEKAFVSTASNAVGSLGSLIGGAWQKAQNLGDRVLDLINPFDSGGIASGTGFMPKNVIAPERVLSPEQTALFEALVQALSKIASTGLAAAGQAVSTVLVDISQASISAFVDSLGIRTAEERAADRTASQAQFTAISDEFKVGQIQTGELISETNVLMERTATSSEAAAAETAAQQMDALVSIATRLTGEVLGPIMASAVDAGTQFLIDVVDGLSKDVVTAVNGTTKAVNNLGDDLAVPDPATTAVFGAPGSSFDLASELSTAFQSVASSATNAFNKVRDDIVNAALSQTKSSVGVESRGLLGENDISGSFLENLIVKVTGVEIEIRDLLSDTLDEVRDFRGDSFRSFNEAGELISDTAVLVDRNQTSIETAMAEQERIQKALIKAVIKYLITAVLIPIITAILSAMITLATTAIGAAIGSVIPIIGTAIGAIIGAAIGAALSGLAAAFVSVLAVGAGAALDAFDEGGIAGGTGFMPKNTIAPERVLSPRQTSAFETLVQVLDGKGGNRSVSVGSMNIYGREPAGQTHDSLLKLLNT